MGSTDNIALSPHIYFSGDLEDDTKEYHLWEWESRASFN